MWGGLLAQQGNEWQNQTVGYSHTCWRECQSLSLQNMTHNNGWSFLMSFKNLLFFLPLCHSYLLCEIGPFNTRCQGCKLMGLWGPIAKTDVCKLFEWKRGIKHITKKRVLQYRPLSSLWTWPSSLSAVWWRWWWGGGVGGEEWGFPQQVLGIRMNSVSESDSTTLIHIYFLKTVSV